MVDAKRGIKITESIVKAVQFRVHIAASGQQACVCTAVGCCDQRVIDLQGLAQVTITLERDGIEKTNLGVFRQFTQRLSICASRPLILADGQVGVAPEYPVLRGERLNDGGALQQGAHLRPQVGFKGVGGGGVCG